MNVEVSTQIGADVARRARALAALADPVRLRVLDALVLGDASPGDLSSHLGLTSNLLAHHLGVLEREGLVARHRSQADRRRSYVRLVAGALDDLLPGVTSASGNAARGTVASVSRVVFVCTANSARSQLAAALWAHHSVVPGVSGGTHPAPTIAEGAVATARRHDLQLADSTPRLLPTVTEDDYVVTVCDNAYEELEPGTVATARRRLHWSVPDPVPARTERAFEDAYADLEGRVITLAQHLTPETALA